MAKMKKPANQMFGVQAFGVYNAQIIEDRVFVELKGGTSGNCLDLARYLRRAAEYLDGVKYALNIPSEEVLEEIDKILKPYGDVPTYGDTNEASFRRLLICLQAMQKAIENHEKPAPRKPRCCNFAYVSEINPDKIGFNIDYLNAKECRKLIAWLIKATEWLEYKERGK